MRALEAQQALLQLWAEHPTAFHDGSQLRAYANEGMPLLAVVDADIHLPDATRWIRVPSFDAIAAYVAAQGFRAYIELHAEGKLDAGRRILVGITIGTAERGRSGEVVHSGIYQQFCIEMTSEAYFIEPGRVIAS